LNIQGLLCVIFHFSKHLLSKTYFRLAFSAPFHLMITCFKGCYICPIVT
jgi:hypothetical protein